jgi:hypothetical protein
MWTPLAIIITKSMSERSSMMVKASNNNEHSFVLGEQIIAALNNNSTVLLLPFMVDPHGGIGPLASHFLFGTTSGTTSDPSPPPLLFQ